MGMGDAHLNPSMGEAGLEGLKFDPRFGLHGET